MKTKLLILPAVLSPVLLLAASGDGRAEEPAETPAINLWVDLGLGLISEDKAAEKARSLDADFKTALKAEANALLERIG